MLKYTKSKTKPGISKAKNTKINKAKQDTKDNQKCIFSFDYKKESKRNKIDSLKKKKSAKSKAKEDVIIKELSSDSEYLIKNDKSLKKGFIKKDKTSADIISLNAPSINDSNNETAKEVQSPLHERVKNLLKRDAVKYKKNKFKNKSTNKVFNSSKALNPRNTIQIKSILPIVLIGTILFLIKVNSDNIKIVALNIHSLKSNNGTVLQLQAELDSKTSELEELKSKEISADNPTASSDNTSGSKTLSTIKVAKPLIVSDLTSLTSSNNMDYVEIIFASNKTDTEKEDENKEEEKEEETTPNQATPNTTPNTTPTQEEGPQASVNENNQTTDPTKEDSLEVSDGISKNGVLFSSTHSNDVLLNYASNNAIANNDTTKNTTSNSDTTKESSSSSSTTSLDTSSVILNNKESENDSANITTIKNSILDNIDRFTQEPAGTYLSERVLIVAKGDSESAFNFIQDLYSNKSIKFNIEYISVVRDKDYMTKKPSMFSYEKSDLSEKAYIGVVVNILSQNDAPSNWVNTVKPSVNVKDLFN